MNIAFVTATRPHAGGMINYLNNYSYGARQLGHHVDIISIFETTAGERKKMPEIDAKMGGILEGRDWLNFIAWQAISLIIFIRFLPNYLKKKYDFVYITDILSFNTLQLWIKLFKIPTILNPVDSVSSVLVSKKMAYPGGWFYQYILRQEKKAYLKAKALLSSGEDISAYIEKVAGKKLDIKIADNSIDEKKFYVNKNTGQAMRSKLNLKDKFIVLYVGRLSQEKGVTFLLRSLPEILKQDPGSNIFLAIGGASGPDKENIINYIKNNNYQDYARMLGYIADEDLNSLYNMSDIFCAPSVVFEGEATDYLKDKKGNKLELTISAATTTLQEAMACGKAVIGSDVPGSKEIIKHGVDGILVPDKNPGAIAQAILKLKNDDEYRQKIATAALTTVQERYLPRVVAQKLISYYYEKFKK